MSGANHPTPETNVAELCGVCGLPHKGLTGYNHNFMSHHLPSKQQLPPVYEAWDRDQLVAEIERLTGELFNARQAVLTEGLARDHSDRMLVETRSALERAWNERDRLRAKLGQLATYVQTTMDSGALMRATVVGITSGALSGEPGSAVETKERQYKGTRESFYCPDCNCPNCGNTRAAVPALTPAAALP